MKKIRFLGLLLALLMICLPVLVACDGGKNESSVADDTSAEVDLSSEFTDKNGNYIAKSSGKDWSDLGTITFLSAGVSTTLQSSEIVYNTYDKDQESNLPSVINEDIKERNEILREKLGVEVQEQYLYDISRYNGLMCTTIRNGNMTATEDYQVVTPCLYDGGTLSVEGQFHDLNELATQGLQITAPWWNQEFNTKMTMGGKLYITVGDIGLVNKNAASALFFNLDYWNRLNLSDTYGGTPYDLVRDGKWTVDLVFEAVKNVGRDLDSDGDIDVDDEFGWGGQLDDMWSIFFAGNCRIADNTGEDGYPELTMYNERSATLMEKMQELTADKQHYISGNDYFNRVQWPMVLVQAGFTEGRALFYNSSVATVTQLGVMEEHFGVVPVPKADELQEKYYSLINPWTSNCFAIPICNSGEHLAMTIDALNVLGAASANTVAKDYDEIVLKYQKTRDDDTVEMLFDYILPNRSADIGMVYKWGDLDTLLHTMASQPIGTFRSNYEASEQKAQQALDETVDYFKGR